MKEPSYVKNWGKSAFQAVGSANRDAQWGSKSEAFEEKTAGH